MRASQQSTSLKSKSFETNIPSESSMSDESEDLMQTEHYDELLWLDYYEDEDEDYVPESLIGRKKTYTSDNESDSDIESDSD